MTTPQEIALKDSLIQELQDLPQIILQKQTELQTQRYLLQELRDAVQTNETKTLADVIADSTFSNDSKRKIEVQRRLSILPGYNALLEQELKFKKELDQLQITLEFMQNKFSAARALSRLLGAD